MSKIKVDEIVDEAGTGAPSFPNGIPAADLTGALPAMDGSALTGVGGATTLITDWTDITSGASAVNVNFTEDYFKYVFLFQEVKLQGAATGNRIEARLTDSSGTAISGSDSYQYGTQANTGANESTMILHTSIHGVGVSGTGICQTYLEVFNPKSSTERTLFNFQTVRQEFGLSNVLKAGFGFMENLEVNNGITFFGHDDFDSGRYKVYGVDL